MLYHLDDMLLPGMYRSTERTNFHFVATLQQQKDVSVVEMGIIKVSGQQAQRCYLNSHT